MNTKIRPLVFTVVLVLLATTSALPTLAQADIFKMDIAWYSDVPCARGGAGETVQFYGTVNLIYKANSYHLNFQGVKATGLITGDTYQVNGMN